MAIGEFGTKSTVVQIANFQCAWPPIKVYDDIFLTQKGANPNNMITWHVDLDTGDITFKDVFAVGTASPFGGHPFRIADGIVGLPYVDNSPNKSAIVTFEIDSDGQYVGDIENTTIGSTNLIWKIDETVHLSGNRYAIVGYYPLTPTPYYGRAIIVSIDPDGTNIVKDDHIGGPNLGNSPYVHASAARIGDDDFIVTWSIRNGDLLAVTYNCTGGTLSQTDSATLQTDVLDSVGYVNNVREIQPDVFACAYLADGPLRKLFTFECDTSGNIGSILDTATGYWPSGFYEMLIIAEGYGLISSDDYSVTFPVETDGTIGAIIDTFETLESNAGSIYWAYTSENLFTGYYNNTLTLNVYGFSCEIDTGYMADRIYVWLGDATTPETHELTDPTYETAMGVRVERGRDDELGYAASGICEVTCDNQNGDFSPENSGGQYYGDLALGKLITVYEVYNGTKYNLFRGKIDSIEPHPEPDDLIAYIVAVDGMDDLAGSEIETVLRTDTDEEELIDDILDAAGWPAADRDLDSGVDTLQVGWYHAYNALRAIQDLEDSTRGFFFVDPEGNAVWQNRHYRVTGDRLTSQFTYNETMMKIGYKWSKRDVRNWAKVIGYKYIDPYYGLPEEEWIYYAPCNFDGAPYIPANSTVTLWGDLSGPRMSSDSLVKGTHWNANSTYDKTGDDLSDNITLTVTYYGQSIKFDIENTGDVDAWMVVPNSPPAGAPTNATLLCYGTIYEELTMTVVKEDTTSQDDHGKRTITVDAKFKSNYNDVLSYAEYLIAKYKDPLPNPIQIKINAWDQYPDDTMKIEVLTRALSDRVTVVSSKLGVNQDYYVDKIAHEYVLYEGGTVHEVTMFLSRALGQGEGVYWILGEVGFSELGETTVLGF